MVLAISIINSMVPLIYLRGTLLFLDVVEHPYR